MDRFIAFKKNDFIGRDVAMAERDAPPARTLVTMTVEADDADCVADEPVFRDGEVVGFVTSGGYAHYSGASVANAMIPRDLAEEGAGFEIEILGERRAAILYTTPLYDADGARMRG